MNRNATTCYVSGPDKAARYVRVTIPSIFAAANNALHGRYFTWQRQVARGASVEQQLRLLHDSVRAGRYLEERDQYGELSSCDEVQNLTQTVLHGGDCEDWAAVMLAVLRQLGIGVEAFLVTSGGDLDNFRHAFVAARHEGRWYVLDGKGDQAGVPFNTHSDNFPVRRYWHMNRGEVHEVRFTGQVQAEMPVHGFGVFGSGNSNPVIKSSADATIWLTAEQMRRYLASYGDPRSPARIAVTSSLLHGYHNLTRSQMLARIQASVASVGLSGSAQVAFALVKPKMLEEANEIMAANVAAGMPIKAVRDFAVAQGANPAADDGKMRVIAATFFALFANAYGVVLDDWIKIVGKDKTARPEDYGYTATAGDSYTVPRGSGKNILEQISRFVRHPLKVLDAAVSDVGGGIKDGMRAILNTEKTVPWLSQYFLKPLGFHMVASLVHEVGNMLEHRSFSAFDERTFVKDVAQTMVSAGQALLVAAPLLPPPWNVAAAALGALSVGMGNLILKVQNQKAGEKQAEVEAEQLGQQLTQEQNALAEVQNRAIAEIQKGNWHEGWVQTPSGARYWAGWMNQGGEWLPAYVWLTDQGWVWTGYFK